MIISSYNNKLKYFSSYSHTTRIQDLHDQNVHVAGWGKRFDFGYHDKEMEIEGTYDSPTRYSSCMTTSESPVASQFQRCDTIEVV